MHLNFGAMDVPRLSANLAPMHLNLNSNPKYYRHLLIPTPLPNHAAKPSQCREYTSFYHPDEEE